MTKWGGFLIGVFIWLLFPGSFMAQAESFTLEELYKRVLEKNEEIQISRESIFHAEEERKRALSTVLPLLRATAEYDHSPKKLGTSGGEFLLQPHDSYEARLTLEQPLYSGGKNSAGIGIAENEIEVAQQDLKLSIESSLFRTAEVFYEALKAQKNRDANQRNVERLQEHQRLSDLRFRVGEVTESILLRAKAELAGAQAELVSLENDLMVLRRELQILADLPGNFELMEPPIPNVPNVNDATLLKIAIEKRNDVIRSLKQEKISEQRVKFARGNFFPTLSLEATYWYREQHPKSSFFIQDSWMVGGRFEFPLFEGGLRKAELAQARSNVEQARLQSSKLRREVDMEVTRASLTLEAVTRQLESRRDQVLFAQKNYEMVSKQFTYGLVTNVELLDANQTLIEAERDVNNASFDRHVAILTLQKSVGLFLSKVMESVQSSM
ncbi:MAG TPA: TolC family protein [Nitrospiria bacterium]|jgi:outer membrane protein